MMAYIVSPLRFTPSLSHLSSTRVRFGPKPSPTAPSRLGFNSMSQPASEANPDTSKPETPDVLVQYVVLRRDLIDTWPLGSVVTQGCHASVSATWSHKDDPHTLQYCSPENIDSMHKVTLEVKGEPQILNLSEKLKAGGIEHKLWIEQPENFPTCLATKPYPKSMVSSYFKKLKLWNTLRGVAYFVIGIVVKERVPVFYSAFNPLGTVMVTILGSFVLAEQLYLRRYAH